MAENRTTKTSKPPKVGTGFPKRNPPRESGNLASSGHARAEAAEAEKLAAQRALDAIVRGIVDDMCAGKWQTGVSHRILADTHGVELKTVQGWAARAAAIIRQCRGNGDEIRDQIVAGVEDIRRRALESKDLRNALSAYELQAKLLGSMATAKIEVTTPPREQLLGRVRNLLQYPTEEIAAILEETGWVRR